MSRFRFTIAGLLVLVFFVAVAALREATEFWDCVISSMTLGLLLASALLAFHRADRDRAFWLGFALCGGIYLGASLIPPIEARLLTTRALAYLDSMLPRQSVVSLNQFLADVSASKGPQNPAQPSNTFAFVANGTTLVGANRQGTIHLWDAATGRLVGAPDGTSENFLRIGHSLLALVLAYLGGLLSQHLYTSGRTRRAGEPESSTTPATTPGAV